MEEEWDELDKMFDELGDGSIEDIMEEEHEEESEDENSDEIEDTGDTDGDDDNSDGEITEEDEESTEPKEEDNSGDSGDRHEDEHIDGGEEDTKQDSFSPIEVEIDGVTITANTIDELKTLAQRKRPTSKKTESDVILEQGNLSSDDLKLFVEAKNGSVEAIAEIARRAEIDRDTLYDAKSEEYKQTQQYNVPTDADVVANEIMADKDLHEKFSNAISVVPKDFVESITANAEDLSHFRDHLKSGLAQEIIPEAMKQMMLNGGKFMDHYIDVGRGLSKTKTEVDKKPKQERKANKDVDELRKRSALNTKAKKKQKSTGDDIWEMTDEEFEAQFE